MYRMVALDLDGTLLNDEHQISEKNKDTLMKLVKKGIKIILLSGREPASIIPFSKELSLKDCMVGLNGSIIVNYSGKKILFEADIKNEIVCTILEKCIQRNIFPIVFIKNTLYISDRNDKRFKLFEKYCNPDVKDVGNVLNFIKQNNLLNSVNKILLSDDHKKLSSLRDDLEQFSNEINSKFSMDSFLEIYNSSASKGKALKKLANYYNITRSQIIAMGNGENDISMLEYAGTGVAMENSFESVKEKADFVTSSNSEDGVSAAIEKYCDI